MALNWARPPLPGWAQSNGWLKRWPWFGAAAFALAVAVAYGFTLASFVDDLRLDTPLAYLPLLPICALGMAWLIGRDAAPTHDDNGHELDLWIAAPLLLAALLLITVVPVFWSTLYWIDRLDVLSLSMFAIGGVTLLFGVGWSWRLRAPLMLLFLMWPAIYVHALPQLLQVGTAATNSVLGFLVATLPLGITRGSDPSLLLVNTGGPVPLLVSVGSACSGANSILGFSLVGGVASTMLTGSLARKVSWLLAGAVLAFVANLIRVLSILLLASAGQPTLALGAYHEVIGLVLFVALIVVALAMLPRFGLRTRIPQDSRRLSIPAADSQRSGRPRRRTVAGLSIFVVLLVVTTVADRALTIYASWITPNGVASIQPFGANTLPPGWRLLHLANYPWGVQYFGAGSSFDRFAIVSDAQTVVADVVRTPDVAALSTYNLEACFLYHSYQVRSVQRVDLGHGVTGQLLDYDDPGSGKRWASVSWIWPVEFRGNTSYERVALSSDLLKGSAAPPTLKAAGGFAPTLLSLSQRLIGASNQEDTAFGGVNARVRGLAALLVAASAHS